jgi:hypothetical protein
VDRAPVGLVNPWAGGTTDHRFDTHQLIAEDLAREEVLVRFHGLDPAQLQHHLAHTTDPTVRLFINTLIQTREAEANAVGNQVVATYMGLPDSLKSPGGACFTVARGRVEDATEEVTSKTLTEHLDPADVSTFDRIWGSLISPRRSWLEIADNVRGRGAPGAMVFAGLGTYVDEEAIWSGGLKPGAVLQTWDLAPDATRVRNGRTPVSYGHSFIFLRYVRAADGTIEGIEIADQGFQSGGTISRGDYGWWIGANITISSTREFVRPEALL